jgi:acetate kinase
VRVLVVNAGSSSLKLALLGDDDETVASSELAAPQAQIDPVTGSSMAASVSAKPC